MKINHKRDPESRQISNKLEAKLGKDNKDAFMMSFLTMASIMANGFQDLFLKQGIPIPPYILYAVVQTYSMLDGMYKLYHDEIPKEKITSEHMPIYDIKNDIDAERRFIFVLKSFYEYLQKEGKL